ncbi:MAG: response regulator [Gemmatimonadota bacterium]|nr:response regulator [Gemmatimonadota bacterium]
MSQQSSDTSAASPAAEPKTILLIDDEQSVRSIVMKILRRANYTVLEADGGESALALSESHAGKIDLVISDLYMPGLHGPAVAEKLSAARPGLKVLFISGYADNDVVGRTGVPAGSNFLQKPFSGQDLTAAVTAALR